MELVEAKNGEAKESNGMASIHIELNLDTMKLSMSGPENRALCMDMLIDAICIVKGKR